MGGILGGVAPFNLTGLRKAGRDGSLSSSPCISSLDRGMAMYNLCARRIS